VDIELHKIIAGCVRKDRKMQKRLYEYFHNNMIRICMRFSNDTDQAASLFNDAMLKVFQKLDGYMEQGKITAWVKRIVVNTCIDHIRLKIPFQTMEITESMEQQFDIPDRVFEKMDLKEIRIWIQSLPKNMALVFHLYVYEEYNHQEIGEILNIPPGTSRYYLCEARKLLKEKLQNQIYLHFQAI
jgi:RNA polymerase sigma-70 factor (ECF subfamily)